MDRIPNASGKTVKLASSAGQVQECKSNTASASDHSCPVFVLSAPGGAETADLLSLFAILRLQSPAKSKHLRYIGGVFQSKGLSISPLN